MLSNNIMKTLIDKKSPISKDKQVKIIEDMFDFFIYYGKDMLYIADGYIYKISSQKVFNTIAYQHLIEKFSNIKYYDEEKNKDRWNIKISDIYNTLVARNSYDLLKYESDLFLDKQKVEKDNLTKTITVTTNKLHIKEIKEPNISKEDYIEIVKDYINHFPQFNEFLKLIIDMRLAKDRKASFLHLRVKSNWGKSFLSGLLKNLQIGFEIDYHNLMNKGANDIAPIQVRNSFVMILDEFNNFSSEMKKLSHSFAFAPKYGMKEEVDLYLKVLMSAEKSPSFSGGVDDQIVNRVMVMDIEDEKAQELDKREVYKKHGNAKYMSALERYSYLVLTKLLKKYLAMDKFEAHKLADTSVKEALSKYKMKDTSNLNEDTKSVIDETIRDILEAKDETLLDPRLRAIKANIIKIEKGRYIGKIFIKQAKKTIETILKSSTSESEFKKMRWKLSDLDSIVNIVANHTKKGYKPTDKHSVSKGLVVELSMQTETEEPPQGYDILRELAKNGNLIIEEDNENYIPI